MDNQFENKGKDQNVAQGDGAIGKQVNIRQQSNGNNNTFTGTGDIHLHPPSSPVIPCDHPALDEHFLGRDRELAELLGALHPGRVVTVCGPGGMGKSALAAQAVHQLAQQEPTHFPDGIVFHSFYGHPKTDQALQTIIRAFGLEPEPPLDITLQRVLSGKKALLILDGAEDAHDLPSVLNLRGSCGVLITSRSPKDAQFTRLDLRPLEDKPAKKLLLAWSGQAIDDETMQRICTVLGGLPVAARIVGHYLRSTGESAAEYLDWLKKEPLQELDQGEHRTESVAVLLRRSVERVSDDARLVLEMAGCLAFAPIAREPITVLLEDDQRRTRTAINELVQYGLLERQEERWQVSHALVHTYARTELPLSKEKMKRLAHSYIGFCLTQSKAGLEGYARLDGERTHCLRLLESCLDSGLWQEVQALATVISEYLDRLGYWIDQLTAIEMNLTAARQAGDRRDEAWCLNSLGYTCSRRGEYDQALKWFKQSLSIDRELGNRKGEGIALNNIGNIYREQDEYEQALEYFQQSLSIAQEVGDRKVEGAILVSIGLLYQVQGSDATALQYYEQDLAICREGGDKQGEGTTLNNIGLIYYEQGKMSKALEYYQQALAIRGEVNDRAGEVVTIWNIGTTYASLGALSLAEKYITLAVNIAEQIGHPNLEEYRDLLERVRVERRVRRRDGS